MYKEKLSERQKNLLRLLAIGLINNTLSMEWIISRQQNRISILTTDGRSSPTNLEGWQSVTQSDLDKFAQLGFLLVAAYDRKKAPSRYTLQKTKIIEIVETDFELPISRNISMKNESLAENRRAVFVIHGRNQHIRDSVFTFLRSIGLQPLEWSQAVIRTGKVAPYVGEILDAAFAYAQAIIVVMTPDDEARLREPFQQADDPSYETELTPQARPNVIFEAGMALGYFPTRTILVEVGKLRPFSDLGGRHVIRLNNETKKRQDLAQRLELAGCLIDLTGTDWHQTGDFELNGK